MSGAAALLGAAPRLAPGMVARRIESGGQPLWVLRNPATGRYFHASPRLYLLAAALDGRTPVQAALAGLPPGGPETNDALLEGLSGMIGAGLLLLPGARPPRRRGNAALSAVGSVAFTRIRLGDLGGAMRVMAPLLGWLYTRTGAAILAVLLAAAAASWAGRGAEIAEQAARFTTFDLSDLVAGYVIFVAAKLLHECGHAVALRRMAAAEGLPPGALPWGVSFMFLMPAPYVDASAAWFLENPRRRAAVGLAGVATDLLVASLAALLWAWLGPSALRDRAFDLVVICGVSSLLFNLNPLVKLDGYYVLSDLAGIPNLMARAQAALSRLVFGPFGLAPAPHAADLPFGLYAAASWIYRWTIYLSIFWLAGGMHWLLAGGVAAVVALLFLALPLLRLAKTVPDAFGRAPARAAVFTAGVAAILGAIAFLPLPQHVVAEGVVVRPGLTLVYARTDGRLTQVAPAGPGQDAAVIRLDNPETDRLMAQLRAEAASLAIEARRARAAGAERVDAAMERQRAVAGQIAALEAERAGWEVMAPAGTSWEPLRAETMEGAWVRRDDSRPLGALLADGPAEIRLILDQSDGPAALAALATDPKAAIALRLRGGTVAQLQGRPAGPPIEARDMLPSPALATAAGGRIPARLDAQGAARPAERVFELRILPDAGAAVAATLRHGARVEARIALAPASLLDQSWRRMRQALQRRLAV
jgi:putative peptide zinc metalloprotease protein